MISKVSSSPKRVAIISVKARSLIGFRGPLIKTLVERGRRVFALAPDFDANTRKEITAMGAEPVDITMARAGMNPFVDVLDTLRLSKVLRRISPDITLGYYIKPVIFGTIAAGMARVPHRVAMIEGLGFVYTQDTNKLSKKKKLLRFLVSWLYRFALKRSHKIAFLNPDDIEDFIRWGLVNSDKVVEIGGIGVDLDEWRPKKATRDQIRFLFIGRLLREKGIEQFVEAARIVKKLVPAAEFVALGDVDVNPSAVSTAQMQAWVAEGLIIWPGHVPVRPWLERSSVFVLPSYREGMPRSTQEAMAMGLPVITTDVPGCRQTVEDGVNGFLVPVRNAEALAGAMLRFIERPELIEIMGREGRRLAEERFDVNKVNEVIMSRMGL